MRFVCTCGQKIVEERVILSEKDVDGQNGATWKTLVRDRRALVCPKDGVIAWFGDEAAPSK